MQMPLYTLWRTASGPEIAWTAVHCSAGDVLIAGAALAGSLLLVGSAGWPRGRHWRVAGASVALGLGATVVIERVAIAWGIWAYSEAMPVLPGLEVGLAPVAQWVVIPAIALASARLAFRRP